MNILTVLLIINIYDTNVNAQEVRTVGKDDCSTKDKECHPEQIHLSFSSTESPNKITVTWSTMKDTRSSILQYRPAGESKYLTVEGTRTLFIDGGPKKLKQTIHRAAMVDLHFNATYEYTVGSKYGTSEIFKFRTVPEGHSWEVRAIIFGDLGVANGVSGPFIKDDVSKRHYDVAIHVGDLAYNMDEEGGKRGDQFMNDMQPLAARLPYMVCPGNHENAYNFTHYRNRFTMPNFQQSENYFYSYNLGPVHFVSINTEAYYDDGHYPLMDYGNPGISIPITELALRIQYEWLENDLKEANKPANRAIRPWIILYGHRPMLCTNSLAADGCRNGEYPHRVGIPKLGGYGLEVLLKKYGVDVAIWAHEHSYERMFPVYNKAVYNGSVEHPYTNPRAPVHFTSGCAGNREAEDGFYKDPAAWSAFRSSDYGYTRLHAYNSSHLHFEQLSTQHAASIQQPTVKLTEPKVIDHFWVIKNVHKPYDTL